MSRNLISSVQHHTTTSSRYERAGEELRKLGSKVGWDSSLSLVLYFLFMCRYSSKLVKVDCEAHFVRLRFRWLVTAWDVYHPLSSTIASGSPSINPGSLIDLLGFRSHEHGSQSRKGRRPNSVRLANAQREEIRESLKAVVVWVSWRHAKTSEVRNHTSY
jgi:hypothetical protein